MTSSPPAVRLGAQEPRVSSYPNAVDTSGPEVVDLSAAAGLVLDPWQRYVFEHALGERDDGRWAATEVACFVPRQNGKGTIIEARVLAGLFLFGERLILWSAHEYKTAQEGFLRIKELIQAAPEFDALVHRYWEANGEQGIELSTGQRLRFVARSRGSGRGFSGDCVILDEAQFLTALQMRALFSTLSARENPQIWYTGTPPDEPTAWIYGVRRDGEAGKPRLAYFDWGQDLTPAQVKDPKILADRERWYAANPALGIRIDVEFCEDELSRLKEDFAPERLGVWLPEAGELTWQVISEDAWRGRVDEVSAIVGELALAIDVTPDRSHATISAAGRRADEDRHIEVIDHRAGTGWIVRRIKQLRARHQVCAVAVDTVGPAASLIVELEEADIEVLKLSTTQVAAACGAFYDGVVPAEPSEDEPDEDETGVPRDRTPIWHLDQAPLTRAVAGAVKRPLGGGASWAWDRVGTDIDLTPLVSTTSAVYAFAATGGRGPIVLTGSLMA